MAEAPDPATVPLVKPPPGVVSNFVNPPSRAEELLVTTTVLIGLMLVAVANRAYVKIRIVRRVTIDDVTITISVLLGLAIWATYVYRGVTGIGCRHMWDISVAQATSPPFKHTALIGTLLPTPQTGFVKLSICLIYFQLFSHLKWARINITVAMTLIIICFGGLSLLLFSIAHSLTYDTPSRYALWAGPIGLFTKCIGVFFDLWLLAIPMLVITPLKLSTKRKVGVMLVFLSGSLANICAILGLYYRVWGLTAGDAEWNNIPNNILIVAEPSISIICSCIPSFMTAARTHGSPHRMLLQKLHILTTTTTRKSTRGNSGPASASQGYVRQNRLTHTVGGGSPGFNIGGKFNALRSTDRKYEQYFEMDEVVLTAKGLEFDGEGVGSVGSMGGAPSEEGSQSARADSDLGIRKQVVIDIESPSIGRAS